MKGHNTNYCVNVPSYLLRGVASTYISSNGIMTRCQAKVTNARVQMILFFYVVGPLTWSAWSGIVRHCACQGIIMHSHTQLDDRYGTSISQRHELEGHTSHTKHTQRRLSRAMIRSKPMIIPAPETNATTGPVRLINYRKDTVL